jgi:hypothetical protein
MSRPADTMHETPPYLGVTGFVLQAASWPADHPTAVAARGAGLRTVLLQWKDPATHNQNSTEWTAGGWARRWRAQGVDVLGWWRVEHAPDSVLEVANAESAEEIALLAEGVPVSALNRHGVVLFAECFRENDEADTTVTGCWQFWLDAKMRPELIRPTLQAYGQPFDTLEQQAADARGCGARGVGVYPAELVSVADWDAIGEALT